MTLDAAGAAEGAAAGELRASPEEGLGTRWSCLLHGVHRSPSLLRSHLLLTE